MCVCECECMYLCVCVCVCVYVVMCYCVCVSQLTQMQVRKMQFPLSINQKKIQPYLSIYLKQRVVCKFII